MAVLKKIKFGDVSTPIAKTVLTAKAGGVMSVAAPTGVTNGENEEADYQYELDVNVDGTTLVKSTTTGDNPVTQLAVGTVPAAQVNVADSGEKFTATNVEDALVELENKITSTGNVAKKYKVVSVASPASTNLAEYKLQVAEGTSESYSNVSSSATIVVPKDQHLKSVVLVDERPAQEGESGPVSGNFLKFTYVLNNGNESDVYVDVSAFLSESEFGDGLEVSNAGVVSVKLGQGLEFGGETGEGVKQSIKVKIDSASEKDSENADFLTVGANGVKIQGIKDEIDRKIAALDVTTDAAVTGQYVAAIQEADGIVSVKTRANVSEAVLNNYAKGSAPAAGSEAVAATDTVNQAIAKLEHQVDAAKSAIQNLDNTDTAAAGQVVTAVSTDNGIAQPTKADLAGVTLGGFNADTTATGAISSSDTLGAAINKLQNQISAASDDHTVVEHASGNTHVTVSGAANANGGTTYTVTESDIASAEGLADEIDRAQDAEGEIADVVGLSGAEGSRTFTPTTNYGTGSTTVVGNMQALDTALKAVSDKANSIQYKVAGTELTFYGMTEHA